MPLKYMYHHHVQFFTATLYKWLPLLNESKCRNIIFDSLQFLTRNQRCEVYGFVLMPNHMHLLWKITPQHRREDVQRDFLKFTAQQFKFYLTKRTPVSYNDLTLDDFRVSLRDRACQFWKRNSLSVDIYSREIAEQKIDYIHNNPVQGKWMLANCPMAYQYSSVRFYENGKDEFGFLKHYMGCF